MRSRLLVLICSVLAVAGCSSATVVTGSGRALAPSGASTTPDFPSASGAVPSSASAPSGPTHDRYPRDGVSTAIGDPARADLCGAIGLAPFAGLGFTPTFADVQLPPGCSVRLNRAGKIILSVFMYATAPRATPTDPKPVRRTESGLSVYAYPFDSGVGNCQRILLAQGIQFTIDAITRAANGTPNRTSSCAGTDAMTTALAAAVAKRAVVTLPVSPTSLSSLDFCGAFEAANRGGLPLYARAKLVSDGFGVECTITTASFDFFLDFEIARTRVPEDTRTVTIGGHAILAGQSNDATHCDFWSVQDPGPRGYERISASADYSATGGAATMCDQTGKALAAFLDAAGLR